MVDIIVCGVIVVGTIIIATLLLMSGNKMSQTQQEKQEDDEEQLRAISAEVYRYSMSHPHSDPAVAFRMWRSNVMLYCNSNGIICPSEVEWQELISQYEIGIPAFVSVIQLQELRNVVETA